MSSLKLVLLALALVLPGGSLLLLGMAAVSAIRSRRLSLLPTRAEPARALLPAPVRREG